MLVWPRSDLDEVTSCKAWRYCRLCCPTMARYRVEKPQFEDAKSETIDVCGSHLSWAVAVLLDPSHAVHLRPCQCPKPDEPR